MLNTLLNNQTRGGPLPVTMTIVLCGGVTALYCCIAFHSVLSLGLLLLFIIVAVDDVVVLQLVMYGYAADIFTYSSSLLETLRRRAPEGGKMKMKIKMERRKLAALPPLKILVGRGGNFLERATPLVLSQMVVDLLVNLLVARGTTA